MQPTIQRHVFSVLVDDEPGILARVVGLFSGRGYNIESLTVASVDTENSVSRITIVSWGTPQILEQIEAQLGRLIPVHKVGDLTRLGAILEKEIALVKVVCAGEKRVEALKVAEAMKAETVDATTESFIFEFTGNADEVSNFIGLMMPLGKIEIVRSGVIALSRGTKTI
jgi:acetolactate synthase-1/3 small subunit